MTDTAVIDHEPQTRVWAVIIDGVEHAALVTVRANACTEPPARMTFQMRAIPPSVPAAEWVRVGMNQTLGDMACEVTALTLLDRISWRADAPEFCTILGEVCSHPDCDEGRACPARR